MRRLVACLVVVAIALAVPALAAEKGMKTMNHMAKGEIVKWDDAAKTFAIKDAKGKEESFVWSDKTKVEGTPKVGDHVVVHFTRAGEQRVAESIAVHMVTAKKK
ncbi:MAG: hypothetical protein LAO51_07330 [Acidobacteriia bacterium]|nr:hypothetical protein [Terriglobia bacterium]